MAARVHRAVQHIVIVLSTLLVLTFSPGRCDNLPSCGVLEFLPDTDCLCLTIMAPNRYFLDNYGGFTAGDTVLVSGTWDSGSHLRCGYDLPAILNNTIRSAHEFPLGCGVLSSDGEDCVYFSSSVYGTGHYGFSLSTWGGFSLGDTVSVVGTIRPSCSSGCIFPVVCVDVESIDGCTPTLSRTNTWGAIRASYR